MSSNRSRRTAAALVAAVLIGGGLTAITPAGAEVAGFAATNWKKVWKKQLQPHADKRYYKKSKSDAKYSTKTETGAALGNYYTKAQTDVAYAPKTQSYTKAESDVKYAPFPQVIRGTYFAVGDVTGIGDPVGDNLHFGVALSQNPTPHYIPSGTAPPAGCSGTVEAPDALPGHLCVFEAVNVNVSSRTILNASGFGGTSRMGANIWVLSNAAGPVYAYGGWAVRPLAVSATSLKDAEPSGSGARAGTP